jgi:hypothetical protein
MANTEQGRRTEATNRIIESARDAEEFALEAVRKFVDTVDAIFPDLSQDGPRRKIIDSAFKMTEQLVGTWTQAAERIVTSAGETFAQPRRTTAAKRAKKAPAKKTSARKSVAKKAAASGKASSKRQRKGA